MLADYLVQITSQDDQLFPVAHKVGAKVAN